MKAVTITVTKEYPQGYLLNYAYDVSDHKAVRVSVVPPKKVSKTSPWPMCNWQRSINMIALLTLIR